MRRSIYRWARDESAATSIEYALIATLVAVVMIAGLGAAFNAIRDKFYIASNSLTSS